MYNAVDLLCGAAGALAATVPARLGVPASSLWPFLVLVQAGLAGAVLASRLTPAVEPPPDAGDVPRPVSTAPASGVGAAMLG